MSTLTPEREITVTPVKREQPPRSDRPRDSMAPVEAVPPAAAPAQARGDERKPARRWRFKRIAGAMALLIATAFGASYGYPYWQWSQVHESTDNAFIDGHILQVSSRINGHVARVLVSDNQSVRAGDVLVELDAADLQAALDEAASRVTAAEADLAAAQSTVAESQAQVAAAEASVAQLTAEAASKEAELHRADVDLAQYTRARDSAAVSGLEFGKAQTNRQTAEAALDAAKKAVTAGQAQVNQARSAQRSRQGRVLVAEAQVAAAKAACEKAKLNLSYAQIRASEDGRITRKSVEPGNFVVPGQPLLALVGTHVWVTANFKETQLAKMRPGQPVEIAVDAYPGMKLRGHVESIQQGAGARFSLLPPENATGNYVKVVQRVPVKIELDEQPGPEEGRVLGPGMSVVPTVKLVEMNRASRQGHESREGS